MRLTAVASLLLFGIVAVRPVEAGTTDYTSRAAFAAATSNLTTVGFNGILPGIPFQSYGQLIVSGVTFTTPTPSVLSEKFVA